MSSQRASTTRRVDWDYVSSGGVHTRQSTDSSGSRVSSFSSSSSGLVVPHSAALAPGDLVSMSRVRTSSYESLSPRTSLAERPFSPVSRFGGQDAEVLDVRSHSRLAQTRHASRELEKVIGQIQPLSLLGQRGSTSTVDTAATISADINRRWEERQRAAEAKRKAMAAAAPPLVTSDAVPAAAQSRDYVQPVLDQVYDAVARMEESDLSLSQILSTTLRRTIEEAISGIQRTASDAQKGKETAEWVVAQRDREIEAVTHSHAREREHIEAINQDLQQQIHSLQANAAAAQGRERDLLAALDDRATEKHALEVDNASLKAQIEQLEAQKDRLATSRSDAVAGRAKLRAELDRLAGSKVASASQNVDHLNTGALVTRVSQDGQEEQVELTQVCEDLHAILSTDNDPMELLQQWDSDASGSLNITQFCDAIRTGAKVSTDEISDRKLLNLFRAIDDSQNRTGSVSVESLSLVLSGGPVPVCHKRKATEAVAHRHESEFSSSSDVHIQGTRAVSDSSQQALQDFDKAAQQQEELLRSLAQNSVAQDAALSQIAEETAAAHNKFAAQRVVDKSSADKAFAKHAADLNGVRSELREAFLATPHDELAQSHENVTLELQGVNHQLAELQQVHDANAKELLAKNEKIAELLAVIESEVTRKKNVQADTKFGMGVDEEAQLTVRGAHTAFKIEDISSDPDVAAAQIDAVTTKVAASLDCDPDEITVAVDEQGLLTIAGSSRITGGAEYTHAKLAAAVRASGANFKQYHSATLRVPGMAVDADGNITDEARRALIASVAQISGTPIEKVHIGNINQDGSVALHVEESLDDSEAGLATVIAGIEAAAVAGTLVKSLRDHGLEVASEVTTVASDADIGHMQVEELDAQLSALPKLADSQKVEIGRLSKLARSSVVDDPAAAVQCTNDAEQAVLEARNRVRPAQKFTMKSEAAAHQAEWTAELNAGSTRYGDGDGDVAITKHSGPSSSPQTLRMADVLGPPPTGPPPLRKRSTHSSQSKSDATNEMQDSSHQLWANDLLDTQGKDEYLRLVEEARAEAVAQRETAASHQEDASKRKSELSEVQRQLEDVQSRYQDAQQESVALSEEHAATRTSLGEQTARAEAAEKEATRLRVVETNASAEIERLTLRLSRTDAELNDFNRDLRNEKRKLEEVHELQRITEREKEAAEKQKEEALSTLIDVRAELEETEADAAAAAARAADDAAAAAMEASESKHRETTLEMDLGAMRVTLSRTEERLTETEAQETSLRSERDTLAASLTAAHVAKEQAEQEAQSIREEWRHYSERLIQAQTSAADFKLKFEAERDRRVKAEQDIKEVRRDARTEMLLFGVQNDVAKSLQEGGSGARGGIKSPISTPAESRSARLQASVSSLHAKHRSSTSGGAR